MDERKNKYIDWDDSVYGTGRTEPPKSRGGAVALLLILVIFLCGIITVLGVLNIKLFQKLQLQQEKELSISFTMEQTQPTEAVTAAIEDTVAAIEDNTVAAAYDGPMSSMDLQQAPQAVANVPEEGGLSLQEIYSRNIGSVASILCSHSTGSSTGTGVILSDEGYIVTNAHVVDRALAITVRLTDNREFTAEIIGSDEITDLAVLRIRAEGLQCAQFGDSGNLRVGDAVVAIGDPLGVEFRGTYTDGIVSAINRDVDMDGRTMTLIQTNAALNSGNSGGPLINCYGQVIGINTMKIGDFASRAGVEGLGFAIPSSLVKEVVDQLITQGYVSGRPTLGIQGESLATFYQHYYRLPAGLYITHVDRSSDAYDKGLEEGDILISINSKRVTTMDELKAALFGLSVGQTVQTVIYREGQQYLVELVLQENRG